MSVNVCWTLRISATSSGDGLSTSGSSVICATRYGSSASQASIRTRWPPWISTRRVPSGTLIILATTPSTPTEYRSSGPGASTSGLRLATITIERSPRRTSLINSMLRCWPTLSGISMSGNVTVSRSGSAPTLCGTCGVPLTSTSRGPRLGAPISITA